MNKRIKKKRSFAYRVQFSFAFIRRREDMRDDAYQKIDGAF